MKGLGRILSVAILWAVTGTIAGWGLQTFIGVDGLLLSCGSLNVAIGMALLQITTLSEEGRNLFYEGKKPYEDYLNLGVVLVWGFPVLLTFLGVLWWIVGKFTS